MKNQSNSRKTVLIIDDDHVLCEALCFCLEKEGFEVFVAHTGREGIAICSERIIDVVLLDQKLPDTRGSEICSPILEHNNQTKIIFITAFPSFDNALEAIRAGAYDYLSKPFELEQVRIAVCRATRTIELENLEALQQYESTKEKEKADLVGKDGGLAEVWKLVKLASSSNAPVLITGETGVGKGVVAKAIHRYWWNHNAPFVAISCPSIAENLIEAELFGYKKGAFTGATADTKGVFEIAGRGTLFLDEIGDLPQHLQVKLLGVLDDKKIKRIGDHVLRPVNARIIAATNIDIEDAIETGTFRSDLYYRLAVIRIHIPPLRERLSDIPDLCKFFINQYPGAEKFKLPDSELSALMSYDWPGNVRELRNLIERAIILRNGPVIRPSELLRQNSRPLSRSSTSMSSGQRILSLKEAEREHIRFTLHACSNNRTHAARALGISRSTLMRKIRLYGL